MATITLNSLERRKFTVFALYEPRKIECIFFDIFYGFFDPQKNKTKGLKHPFIFLTFLLYS